MRGQVNTLQVEGSQLGTPMLSYPAPFQYGAQVRSAHDYKLHEYIDEQKLNTFKSPFETPYTTINIDLKYFKILYEDVDDKNKGDINGQTVLHALCLYGSVNAVKIALEAGADLGCEDRSGFTVAHYCAMSDRADILAYLDRKGVSITKQALGTSRTPLHIASMCNSEASVNYLVAQGVNLNQTDNYGYSPLWLALYYRNDGICRVLSEQGAQVNLTEVDKVSFPFRALERCGEYGRWLLSTYLTSCPYRGVSCVWLNHLVNGVSYQNTDLTHSFLYLAPPGSDVIEHPVMRHYIKAAWRHFGLKAAVLDFGLYVVFTVLWTLHLMSDNGNTFRDKTNVARIVTYCLLLPYLVFIIYRTLTRVRVLYRRQSECLRFESGLADKELDNLHPCMWNAYHVLVRQKKELYERTGELRIGRVLQTYLVELTVMLLSVVVLVLDLVLAGITKERKHGVNYIYNIATSSTLILVWTEMFYKLRHFKEFSTFFISTTKIVRLISKWGVMFLMFYIPIACVFWKTIYEPVQRNQTQPVLPGASTGLGVSTGLGADATDKVTFLDSFYRIYRMTYSDYTYSDGLKMATALGIPSWWNILTFYWITVGGLILLRIFGGMVFAVLSEPLAQSQITAHTARLLFICETVMNQSSARRQEFARHLELDCRPLVITRADEVVGVSTLQEQIDRINRQLESTSRNIQDRSISTSSGLNI